MGSEEVTTSLNRISVNEIYGSEMRINVLHLSREVIDKQAMIITGHVRKINNRNGYLKCGNCVSRIYWRETLLLSLDTRRRTFINATMRSVAKMLHTGSSKDSFPSYKGDKLCF